ncbi:MAG TPA: response regulator [Desulfotignum sp.]|nr:response regulator [Desulfotignum sp.]
MTNKHLGVEKMPETASAPASILVIDDETAILRMLAMALSRQGYRVDTADSGENGVEKLQSKEYHLVITDMVMGRMSGEDVLKKVRVLKGDSVPVIAMSGTPWLMDEHLFDAVIPKPYSLKLLFEMVHNFLFPISDKMPLPDA